MATTSADVPFVRSGTERPLYLSAAIAAAVIVLAGFAPTFYLKGFFGTPDLDGLRLFHGVVMTGWFALFFTQARLASTGRIGTHRQLGVAGIFFAILLVATGMTLGIASARAGVSPVPGISPLVFLVLPVGEMVAFTGLFSTAIALRRRPAHHKRLMLLASLAMLTPAFARFPLDRIGLAGPPAFFGLTDVVILACIAYDTARNRRLHPAFVAGFIFIVVVQFGRLALSQTAAWTTFAQWLVS